MAYVSGSTFLSKGVKQQYQRVRFLGLEFALWNMLIEVNTVVLYLRVQLLSGIQRRHSQAQQSTPHWFFGSIISSLTNTPQERRKSTLNVWLWHSSIPTAYVCLFSLNLSFSSMIGPKFNSHLREGQTMLPKARQKWCRPSTTQLCQSTLFLICSSPCCPSPQPHTTLPMHLKRLVCSSYNDDTT